MKAWQGKKGQDSPYLEQSIEGPSINSGQGMADWRKRHAFLFKTIAFILIFAFILYDITWAQGGQPIWHQAKPDIKINGKTRLNGIQIPYDAGTAQEAYSNEGNEVVVNIQDAHASLSAQESIVKILKNLTANHDLDLIALEGAEGPVDISLLRTFPDPEVRKKTAEYLMGRGKMSAGEFFSTVSEKPIKLYGVENNDLYRQNVEALNKVMGRKVKCIQSIDGLIKTLEALEPKVYSKHLLKLNNSSILHHKGKLAFTEHWNFIEKLARRNNIETVIFENLSKLLKSIGLEKEIDFNKANEDRKLLIDELSRVLPKRELEKLVIESLSFKTGKISQGEFHRYLVRLAEDAKLSPAPYSNLIKFTQYITIYEDIDTIALFAEVEEFEDYIREKIFRNDGERTLHNLTRAIRTVKKLFEISMNNNDYDFIISKKRYFDRALFSEFIKKGYFKYKLPFEHPYDLDVIFSDLDEAVEFYNIAQRRNNAMLQNTLHVMRRSNEEVAALITGGFHSKGLSALMKESGLSYLIVMPKFAEGEQRPYLAVLTNKKQPYEELLDAGEYILAAEAFHQAMNPATREEGLTVALGLSAIGRGVKVDWEFRKRILADFIAGYNGKELNEDIEEFEETMGRLHIRPITPEWVARILGLDLRTMEPLEKKTGVYAEETFKIGDKTAVIIRKYEEGKLRLELALTIDKEGKVDFGEVPPEVKEELRKSERRERRKIGIKIAAVLQDQKFREAALRAVDISRYHYSHVEKPIKEYVRKEALPLIVSERIEKAPKGVIRATVYSLLELKTTAEMHRQRAKRFDLDIEARLSKEELEFISKRPQELLETMGISDVVRRLEVKPLSIEDIYKNYRAEGYAPENILIIDRQRNLTDAEEDFLTMQREEDRPVIVQYRDRITKLAFDIALRLWANRTGIPEMPGIEIIKRGLLIFVLPPMKAESEKLEREIRRYREILMAA